MTIVYACRHVSRQGPVEPVVHRRMRCPRCRGKKKKPRAVTTIFLSLLCLLALATSAAAECAWVLWQRDDSFDARGALVSSPTAIFATYTTSAACIAAIDRLERQWQEQETVVARDAQTTLAVMFRDKSQRITKSISLLCAPDTVDPREPKGK
jgi:hypothetical protein